MDCYEKVEISLKEICEECNCYEKNAIATGIASVCRLCKDCRENHSENCIVSLCRRSLESTHLKEEVEYPGNVLMYIVNVAKQDSSFADKIKTEYIHI